MEGPSRRRQAWAWGCLSFCFPQLRARRVGAIPVDGCNCCNSLERSPPPPQATAATAATAAPATAAISPSSPQLFARSASSAATAGPRTGLVPGGAHARASCCAAMWSRPRTGLVPGGDGRKYREVWPAKSGVAVVHPAPNPLNHFIIVCRYIPGGGGGATQNPSQNGLPPPPAVVAQHGCQVSSKEAAQRAWMAPSRGSGSGEEELEDLWNFLYDLGQEAQGARSQKQEACLGCAALEL